MQKSVIGYGSIFHKEDITHIQDISDTSFLGEHILFYAGRYAIKHVIDCITLTRTIDTLWVPNYYCPYVKNWLEQRPISIKYYDIDPFDTEAQVDWKQFSTSDVVLLNNYWGIKINDIPNGNRPLVIEDHSHGWLSEGCLTSKADFCIASLRKTLPVPLSGIAWKPKLGICEIPLSPLNDIGSGTNPMTESWDLIDTAMSKKAICIDPEEKSEFLSSYGIGEMILRSTQEIFKVQRTHETVIRNYLFKDFNSYKKKNLRFITEGLKDSNNFKVVFRENPVPFGLLLIFKDKVALNSFKKYLIDNAIYPAELWPHNEINQPYKHLLNIHVDFRYDKLDMDYLVRKINQWTYPNTTLDSIAEMQQLKNISK